MKHWNISFFFFFFLCGKCLQTGSTTSSAVMQGAVAEPINNPNMFRKAKGERSVDGKDILVKEYHTLNFPYLSRQLLKEPWWQHPIGPIFTRESTKDCNIPANTRLVIKLWAIERVPNYWENFLGFHHERFMAKGGWEEK